MLPHHKPNFISNFRRVLKNLNFFTLLTNFKISDFNKEYMSSLKMI